jgi:hypothetical protein
MARQAAAGLLGIHINLPAAVPPEVGAALAVGGPAPAGLSEKEHAAFDSLDTFYKKYRAYSVMMATRPQTIGYALTDSPAGLAAWMYDYNDGEPQRLLSQDEFLDDVTLYWLTNSAGSSARLYWENQEPEGTQDPVAYSAATPRATPAGMDFVDLFADRLVGGRRAPRDHRARPLQDDRLGERRGGRARNRLAATAGEEQKTARRAGQLIPAGWRRSNQRYFGPNTSMATRPAFTAQGQPA